MSKNVQTCQPGAALTEVAQTMAQINCGCVPVVEGGRIVGVVTDRDIVLRAVANGKDVRTTTAQDCMTSPAITASPDMDAHEAADMMSEKQIRRLCCVEGDTVVGIVSLGDLATQQIHVNEAGEALSSISEPAQPGAH